MELMELILLLIAIPANVAGAIQLWRWRWWRPGPKPPATLLDRVRDLLRAQFQVDVASIIIVILMFSLLLALFM